MKKNEILELAEWFSKSNLTKFHWSEDKFSVSFGKEGSRTLQSVRKVEMEESVVPMEVQETEKHVLEEKKAEGHIVKSPVVGTFYTSASPEAKPFVIIGQTVKKGETLCIIEAMKLLNEITSPVDGVVKDIFVSNETLVEYDGKLMEIEVQ